MSAGFSRAGLRAAVASLSTLLRAWAPDAAPPKSALALVLIASANLVGMAALWRTVKQTLGPMARTPEPPPVPQRRGNERFGMTETVRRDVFRELADAEINERRRAITMNTWGGHAWSREDDLGYVQRARAREVAARYRLTLTQMYLVLDEGIRERWPGPDGEPLRATSEPISLRSE
jgi:hypothetical protein